MKGDSLGKLNANSVFIGCTDSRRHHTVDMSTSCRLLQYVRDLNFRVRTMIFTKERYIIMNLDRILRM